MRYLLLLIASFGCLLNSVYATGSTKSNQPSNLIVVHSEEEVSHLEQNVDIEVEVARSLNLATKTTIEEWGFEKLKEMAISKGFTHLLITEKPLTGISLRKRNYKVVLRGTAYK